MSDPRVEAIRVAVKQLMANATSLPVTPQEIALTAVAAVDAVSSQYEQVGRCEFAWNDTFRRLPDVHPSQMSLERDERGWTRLYARIVPTSDGDGLDAVRGATRDELRENDHARLLAHEDADRTTTGAALPGVATNVVRRRSGTGMRGHGRY